MELETGTVVQEVGANNEHASKWAVVKRVQTTRHRNCYLARNARAELGDQEAILTVCRYETRLLGNRNYVDNLRRRLLHEAEMLAVPLNVLPEPIDLFTTHNDRDAFLFPEAHAYRDSEPILVTEPYHGETLDVLVEAERALQERRVLRIGLELIDLMEDLHRRGTLLYELRPEDTIVDVSDHDRIWILDCANYQTMGADGTTQVKDLVVPLSDFSFAAPEVEGGRAALGPRSDFYSFGALMLYMLTGKPPREIVGSATGGLGVYGLHDLSFETCRLLGRCLSPSPSHRFAEVGEIRTAILECLRHAGSPSPHRIDNVSVTVQGHCHIVQWQLPPQWPSSHGVRVGCWPSKDSVAADVSLWETLVDEMPSERQLVVHEARLRGATYHYSVTAQAPDADGLRLSHPAFACAHVPRPSTWAGHLICFTAAKARRLWEIGAAARAQRH